MGGWVHAFWGSTTVQCRCVSGRSVSCASRELSSQTSIQGLVTPPLVPSGARSCKYSRIVHVCRDRLMYTGSLYLDRSGTRVPGAHIIRPTSPWWVPVFARGRAWWCSSSDALMLGAGEGAAERRRPRHCPLAPLAPRRARRARRALSPTTRAPPGGRASQRQAPHSRTITTRVGADSRPPPRSSYFPDAARGSALATPEATAMCPSPLYSHCSSCRSW